MAQIPFSLMYLQACPRLFFFSLTFLLSYSYFKLSNWHLSITAAKWSLKGSYICIIHNKVVVYIVDEQFKAL